MIREPKIFLLDEPLSNLDAALRTTMRSEIIDLPQKRLSVTTVYVTLDQIKAMTMQVHRIAVFKDGVVHHKSIRQSSSIRTPPTSSSPASSAPKDELFARFDHPAAGNSLRLPASFRDRFSEF